MGCELFRVGQYCPTQDTSIHDTGTSRYWIENLDSGPTRGYTKSGISMNFIQECANVTLSIVFTFLYLENL
jgi:hypothetical protein